MLIKLSKPLTFKKSTPFLLEIPKTIEDKAQILWKEFVKNREGYWDGDVYAATKIALANDLIEISQTKYSNLIYAKENSDLTVRSLFVSTLIKTTDNKNVVIKSNHGNINIIGGMADKKDFSGNFFIPELCLKREVKEEIGLDITDKNEVLNFKMKYVKVPDNDENYYPVGIIYITSINFSSEEFNEYMKSHKFDGEIVDWHFYTDEECLNLSLKEDDITYLKELIKLEQNDITN